MYPIKSLNILAKVFLCTY